MKYVFIDDCGTELFNQEFDEKEDAINEAQATWNHLSESDKKKTESVLHHRKCQPRRGIRKSSGRRNYTDLEITSIISGGNNGK